jgi:hypothetical protein
MLAPLSGAGNFQCRANVRGGPEAQAGSTDTASESYTQTSLRSSPRATFCRVVGRQLCMEAQSDHASDLRRHKLRLGVRVLD